MAWTDERVQILKKMWLEGFSSGQIAAELGGITRGGIIGKVHRLGLADRKRKTSANPRPRKPRGQADMTLFHAPPKFACVAVKPDSEPIENFAPIEKRCTILDLKKDSCRWPIGDPGRPDFFFCGGTSVPKSSYCTYHLRIAYQALADRGSDKQAA